MVTQKRAETKERRLRG
jgi:hypothetical protein